MSNSTLTFIGKLKPGKSGRYHSKIQASIISIPEKHPYLFSSPVHHWLFCSSRRHLSFSLISLHISIVKRLWSSKAHPYKTRTQIQTKYFSPQVTPGHVITSRHGKNWMLYFPNCQAIPNRATQTLKTNGKTSTKTSL